MKVIKRDGRAVEYNNEKICVAIEKANKEVSESNRATSKEIDYIVSYIESLNKKRILVEDIQDIIEQKLMELGKYDLAKKYIVYRYTRALVRKQNTTDESILGLIKNVNNESDSGNKTPIIASVQRDLIAGEVSKDLTKRILLPEKINKAHENGIIHFHDTEYFLQPIINSCLVNIEDMLYNGTIINDNKIDQPATFQMACVIFAQIIMAISDSQYGKQYLNVKHLGRYFRKSYDKLKLELSEVIEEDLIDKIVTKMLKKELSEGIKTIEYQINSLISTYEKKSVVTLILELDNEDKYYKENVMIVTEILNQYLEEVNKDTEHNKVLPVLICNFKNIDDKEIQELCKIAEQCNITVNTKDIDKYKYEGHFNQGIVSINLPQIAIETENDENEFWRILDERLEICYEALMCKHYALLGTISDVSPIHWQNGAISRLKQGERIDKLLKDGYSDISLGYVGLGETIKILASKFEWNDDIKDRYFSKILRYLEDRVQKWKKMTGIDFTVEKTINTNANFRLFKIDKNKYGKILNVFDSNCYKD